jgi:hypothetical protein
MFKNKQEKNEPLTQAICNKGFSGNSSIIINNKTHTEKLMRNQNQFVLTTNVIFSSYGKCSCFNQRNSLD